MDDVNKIVAAIFAAQRCSHAAKKPEDFLHEYDAFLRLLRERDEKRAAEPDIAGYAAVMAKALS
jgi:hypothetical protein